MIWEKYEMRTIGLLYYPALNRIKYTPTNPLLTY